MTRKKYLFINELGPLSKTDVAALRGINAVQAHPVALRLYKALRKVDRTTDGPGRLASLLNVHSDQIYSALERLTDIEMLERQGDEPGLAVYTVLAVPNQRTRKPTDMRWSQDVVRIAGQPINTFDNLEWNRLYVALDRLDEQAARLYVQLQYQLTDFGYREIAWGEVCQEIDLTTRVAQRLLRTLEAESLVHVIRDGVFMIVLRPQRWMTREIAEWNTSKTIVEPVRALKIKDLLRVISGDKLTCLHIGDEPGNLCQGVGAAACPPHRNVTTIAVSL